MLPVQCLVRRRTFQSEPNSGESYSTRWPTATSTASTTPTAWGREFDRGLVRAQLEQRLVPSDRIADID